MIMWPTTSFSSQRTESWRDLLVCIKLVFKPKAVPSRRSRFGVRVREKSKKLCKET